MTEATNSTQISVIKKKEFPTYLYDFALL
jgi:hypothetical protein